MPRCSNCGKVNREGSLFCQDCGHKIEGGGGRTSSSTMGPTCGACGTPNPASMNFCKMCGKSLAQKSTPVETSVPAGAVATPATGSVSKIVCPACHKTTPVGFAFCQHCGQRLTAAVEGQSPSVSQVTPTPPAGLPRATGNSKLSEAPAVRAGSNGTTGMSPALSQTDPAGISQSAVRAKASAMQAPKATAEGNFGTLVAVNRDGSDGSRVTIHEEQFDVGRSEGALLFASDLYVASRHARFLSRGGKMFLSPLDTVNGVYLRVQSGGHDLNPGDQFLIGKEVLRFEALLPEERDPPQLVEHGVRLFGTFPREAWGRLRQITIAGTSRDIWHLVRPELVMGREEGDVTFPDDEFMSRRHAAIKRIGPKVRLEDLDSSNGTYLRVRGEHALEPGDMLRIGDQLLRFES